MITLYHYSLPFEKIFRSASAGYTHREGLIITYGDPDLGLFSAEAAPLPGFSTESFSEIKTKAETAARNFHTLLKREPDLPLFNSFLEDLNSYPSLQFAFSSITLSLLISKKKAPEWFATRFSPAKTVQINDVIGVMQPDEFHRSMTNSIKLGFKTIKVKCPYPFGELPPLLRYYSQKYPDLRFRLDANQSWPDHALEEFPELFEHIPIEYVEEPNNSMKSGVWPPGLPVAFDESIGNLDELKGVLAEDPDCFVVIKPSLYGNIFALSETILRYRSMGSRVIFSTLLESAVGRNTILLLATTLGDSDLAHGLNTGKLFKKDLLPPDHTFTDSPAVACDPINFKIPVPDDPRLKTLITIY